MIARNPEDGSSLPYLVNLPIGSAGTVLKVRGLWSRATKLYRHQAEWPSDPDIVERIRCGPASVAVPRSTTLCSTAADRTGRSSCSRRPGVAT
jgi:hypothetical protein